MLLFWALAVAGLLTPPLRVVVNIPAYRLEAFVGDSVVMTMRVAPGMPRYRTPRGSFAITRIEWNPWWIPPKSPWAVKEKTTAPGPDNPMGRVKLNFDALYFLHGSPFEKSIGTAASHGCIRLRNADAVALARLVHSFGTPVLSPDSVDAVAADTSTRAFALDVPVPVEIRYDVVEVRAGRVFVYRDIYGLAVRSLRDEITAVLAEHGFDTTRVKEAHLRVFARTRPSRWRSIALDSLVDAPPISGVPTPMPKLPDRHLRQSPAPL